jgi:hypothetical protein
MASGKKSEQVVTQPVPESRRLRVSFIVGSQEGFLPEVVQGRLGIEDLSKPTDLLLVDVPESSEHHTHLTVQQISAVRMEAVGRTEAGEEEEPAEEDAWTFDLVPFSEPADSEELAEYPHFKHSEFFEALRAATPQAASYHPTFWVDYLFNRSDAQWRIPLMANPPSFDDFPSEIGGISLSGLTLDFRKSSTGLLQATLNTTISGRYLYLSLLCGLHLEASKLEHLFEEAEAFGDDLLALFVTSTG